MKNEIFEFLLAWERLLLPIIVVLVSVVLSRILTRKFKDVPRRDNEVLKVKIEKESLREEAQVESAP